MIPEFFPTKNSKGQITNQQNKMTLRGNGGTLL